ncbi:Integrase core domain protein [Legionella massiliensis]|uniref:Integrase core domain protein n=1 Tax=Legionella massiliensis TaxID=1034943 RepID=A0A078KVD2_9GAMM|nr:DDE-type integrase/transposase/recombinase [Legionella massiliensis]CDZ76927.1 Integrase core domain protein [Legionella massiliensis]CEE12665.1 Integrase core domain protein [Legionella massiliensis]
MPSHIEGSLLDVKDKHPSWGAKKIKSWLEQEKKDVSWPAKSTIDELFKRHRLVRPAKRKRRVSPYTEPFVLCNQANDTWSIDYKGQFSLGNQQLCYPLTVTDNFSRYLLAIEGSEKISGIKVKNALIRLFLEHGLPLAIRSDNGVPFASHAIAGLSELSVWLIKLGIVPERIRKGHPEENGRHERMHLTLKKETASPPKQNMAQQQLLFNAFKKEFNEQRPHEGIQFNRPAWLYTNSSRQFPTKISAVEYDNSFEKTRKIRTNGTMKWKRKEIFVSETLRGERIAMKPHSELEWIIYFSFKPLALFNEKTLEINKIMIT